MTEPQAAQGDMPHSSQGKTLRVGGLSIEVDAGWVTLHNQRLDLTLYEYKVLVHLARRAGQIVAATELLQQVWGCDGTRRKKLNDTVYRLRQKIEPNTRDPSTSSQRGAVAITCQRGLRMTPVQCPAPKTRLRLSFIQFSSG